MTEETWGPEKHNASNSPFQKVRNNMSVKINSARTVLKISALVIIAVLSNGASIASAESSVNETLRKNVNASTLKAQESYDIQDEFIPVRPDIASSFLKPVVTGLKAETNESAPVNESPNIGQAPENKTDEQKNAVKSGDHQEKDRNTTGTAAQSSTPKKPPALNELVKMATELKASGDNKGALNSLEQAAKLASSTNDKKAEALISRSAAEIALELGSTNVALNYIGKAIELNKILKNARGRSLDLIVAGKILQSTQRDIDALGAFEEAIKILPASEQGETPFILGSSADILIRLQRYQDALNALNKLGAYYARNGNPQAQAANHLKTGNVYLLKSDHRNARAEFKKAEKMFRDTSQSQQLGETLLRIAYLDQLLGNSKEAATALAEGQRLVGNAEQSESAGLSMYVSGMSLLSEGKTDQAIRDLSQALERYIQVKDTEMTVRVRYDLAQANALAGKFNVASEQARKVLDDLKVVNIPECEAGAQLILAEGALRSGQLKKSVELAQQSFQTAKKIGARETAIMARLVMAEAYGDLGSPSASVKLIKEVIEDAKSGVTARTANQVRMSIAKFRLSRESTDKAIESATEARKGFLESKDVGGAAECDLIIGMAYELAGESDKASDPLKNALSKFLEVGDSFGAGKTLTALGVHYKNLGDYDKALDHFTKSLEARKRAGDRRGLAANLANIGNLVRRKGQTAEAVDHLKQALIIFQETGDKKGEADIYTSMAHIEVSESASAAALEKFKKALELHKEVSDIRGSAIDLVGIGGVYLARGEIENASVYFREADAYTKRLNNPRAEIALYSELAMFHRARRNNAEALANLRRAHELALRIKDTNAASTLNVKTASLLEDSGEYSKAIALLNQSLEQMVKQGDKRGELWAVGAMGIIQAKMEEYEVALKTLEKASRLRSQIGVTPARSQEIDYHLGEIYEAFGDYERALESYHQALSLSETRGADVLVGRIYDRIGNIYFRTEEYSKAKEFLEEAFRTHYETGALEMQKTELIRLGDIASKMNDLEGALKYQQRALTLTRDTKDKKSEARTLTRIGTLNQTVGKPRGAMDDYREAMSIRSAMGDRRGVNENLLQIAMLSTTLGDHESALEDLRKALEIAQASEDRSMMWKGYFILGRTLEEKKNFGEALEAYRKSLSIVEAMEADYTEESDEDDFIFGGKTTLFETTLRVMMNLAKKDPGGAYDSRALRIAESLKASSFESTLARINVENFSDVPNELLIKEKSLKLSLKRLNEKLMEERSKANPNQGLIKKLIEDRKVKEKSYGLLREQFAREYPAYADLKRPRPMSAHELQKSLDPDEAIIQYTVTRGRTYVFAIDKHRFHTFSVDYPYTELEKDVDSIVRPLQKVDIQSNWDPSIAYKIYSKIFQPVEFILNGKKTAVIVPHGPLTSLPFEILVDSKAHQSRRFWSASERPSFLIEKYAFCYEPSSYLMAWSRKIHHNKRPGWNMVAFADALYTDSDKSRELNPGAQRLLGSLNAMPYSSRGDYLRPLPGSRKEVSEVIRLLGGPTQSYFGHEVTETLFKKADLSRYAYIHLATHEVQLKGAGKFQQQPAVAFSIYGDRENDGFLQLGEVFGLKLNADMVVISSCLAPSRTSSGESSGLYELSRAFLFSGASSVILSMWQVNDDSTAKLFIEMYRNLPDGSKADALRKAKLELLMNQGTSHPYYWAPFILVGDWKVKFGPNLKKEAPEGVGFNSVSTWRKLLSM